MTKLLAAGKTDLLDKFVSMRTRRGFKAFLAWSKEEGKVIFEFEPRPEGARKYPPRKTAAAKTASAKTTAPAAKKVAAKKAPVKKVAAKKTAAKKTVAKKKSS
jgi:DNA topoisomerase-3